MSIEQLKCIYTHVYQEGGDDGSEVMVLVIVVIVASTPAVAAEQQQQRRVASLPTSILINIIALIPYI